MRDELFGDLALLRGPVGLALERLVAREELLDLHRVIGERLRGRIDGGEPPADHHDRQADLQVGDRLALRGAGELQRHEEVRGGANSPGETVWKLEHRWPAGA